MNIEKKVRVTKPNGNEPLEQFFERRLWTPNTNFETMRQYRLWTKQYFESIGKDPNTYFKSKPDYTQDIMKYFSHLQKNTRKTQKLGITIVKNFLKVMSPETKELDIWDTLRENLKGTGTTSDEYVPDFTEIKRILNYCDLRTRAAVIVAASSGLRIKELVSLETGDIFLKETPARIVVREEVSKTKRKRTTYISQEAKEILTQWINEKEAYLKEAHKSMNFKQAKKIDYLNDPRVFPFHMNAIRNGFHKAARKAGFNNTTKLKGDKGKDRVRERLNLHFHNLRKSFRTYLGNPDLAEHLMGHQGYLSQYRNWNQNQLAELYLKHMKNVSVYETTPDLTKQNETIEKLQDRIKELESTNIIEQIKGNPELMNQLGNLLLNQLKK